MTALAAHKSSLSSSYLRHREVETTPGERLQSIIKKGEVGALKDVLPLNDINQPLPNKQLPLHFAVVENQPQIVSALLEAGADTMCKDCHGLLATDYIDSCKDQETFQAIFNEHFHKTYPAWSAASRTAGFFYRVAIGTILEFGLLVPVAGLSLKLLPPVRTVIPDEVFQRVHHLFRGPTVQLRDSLSEILPALEVKFSHGEAKSLNCTRLILGVMIEEFACRGAVQLLGLREILRLTLKKLAPQHATLVDHKIAKVVRVVFTALLFALAHGHRYGNCPGFLAPQFFAGCLYGYWLECGTSLTELFAIHFAFDLLVISRFGGVDMEGPVC